MRFKRAEMSGGQAMVWVVAILAAVYLFAQYQTPGAGVPSEEPGSVTPGKIPCPYAPTVALTAQDEYDSSVDVDSGTWKYILNDGGATTDADGSFEVTKGDILQILVADANSSTHYRALWEEPIAKCGLNSLLYKEVVKYGTYPVTCFNEDGDPINGTTYGKNTTIGSGGTRSIECHMEVTADTGVPYGGELVLELNKTAYEENKLGLTWEGSSTGTTPDAYTGGTTEAATRTFNIPAFKDAQTITFYVNNIKAESGVNPTDSSGAPSLTHYGGGIVGSLYPINCFEEEDVTPSEFQCGVEDMDSTFMSPGGTGKSNAAVARFLIPVN